MTADGHDGRLTLGLLLNSREVPRWFRVALERSLALDGVSLGLVVLNGQASRPRRGRLRRMLSGAVGPRELNTFLYRQYRDWDRRRHVRPDEDALVPVSIEDLLADVPCITVEPRCTRFSDRFRDEDLERIAAHAPDLLIRGGFRILRGAILGVARLGIWSYHHGDATLYRGGPSGFWETLSGELVAGSTLQRLTEVLDGGQVLARTTSPATDYSPALTRNAIYWDSVDLLPRCLRRLQECGDPVDHSAGGVAPRGRVYRDPGTLPTLRMMVRYAASRLARPDRIFLWHWTIGLVRGDGERMEAALGTAPEELTAPPGRFWADPCLVREGDDTWLFFEDYGYRAGKGVIGCLRLDPDGGHAAPPRTVLEEDGHLSSPQVFSLDGTLCMLPESENARRVQLYRPVEFPWRWEPAECLLDDVRVVDPVLLAHEGRYWLFGTHVPDHPGSRVSVLRLWHAPRLEGPWVEHPMSPIVSDCRTGRAAGRIFRSSGRLIRPAQDGSGGYGRAVRFQEIVELSPERYRERSLGSIEPGRVGAEGCHSFSFAGEWIAVDLRRSRRRTTVGA